MGLHPEQGQKGQKCFHCAITYVVGEMGKLAGRNLLNEYPYSFPAMEYSQLDPVNSSRSDDLSLSLFSSTLWPLLNIILAAILPLPTMAECISNDEASILSKDQFLPGSEV